jgi:NDP-sugar pyrophosphorylase family protein
LAATCLNDIDIVILAGGQGTRLQSVVADRPKVLAPIDGVPFLRRYLDWLATFGARRVILALGYKADMVQDYIATEDWAGMELETSIETTPLGTAGGLRAALPLIQSETALVTNGDSVTRLDLCRFVEFHHRQHARLSMVLTHQPHVSASGVVQTDTNDAVTSFTEKPAGQATGGHINTGLYLIQRDAIGEIPADRPVSIERDVFPQFCGRGFYALKGEFPFIDIGTPDSYRRATEFFAEAAA